jgi:hypothetical protein
MMMRVWSVIFASALRIGRQKDAMNSSVHAVMKNENQYNIELPSGPVEKW